MIDPFRLERFVRAQEPVFADVIQELADGKKRTHCMWFVFPQLSGLGFSPMAKEYAIRSLAEAETYLQHPILGPRLIQCTLIVNKIEGRSLRQIFGTPDDLKFHSSMTLFSRVPACAAVFDESLRLHFGRKPDPATVRLLASEPAPGYRARQGTGERGVSDD